MNLMLLSTTYLGKVEMSREDGGVTENFMPNFPENVMVNIILEISPCIGCISLVKKAKVFFMFKMEPVLHFCSLFLLL